MPFRPERFRKSLSAHVDQATTARVTGDLAPYQAARSPARKAAWISELMERLEAAVGLAVAGAVMEECGRECIGKSTLAKARQIAAGALDLDDLLAQLNAARLGGGHLRREGNVIHAAYDRCYCGSVSKAKAPLSRTYCRCSCGWYGQLFEAALGRPVEVELLGSIASGDERCRFLIHL